MEEDLIVVDDVEDRAAGPSVPNGSMGPQSSQAPRTAATRTLTRSSSRRSTPGPVHPSLMEHTETRTTRSATARFKPQPKLKLKLSEKAAAQAPGMSFLGPFDRELDSDDEDLVFEEQFILRMPPGEDSEKLRKMVQAREVSNDVWFKFKGGSCCICSTQQNLSILYQILGGQSSTLETTRTHRSSLTCRVSSSRRKRLITNRCSKWQIYVRSRNPSRMFRDHSNKTIDACRRQSYRE